MRRIIINNYEKLEERLDKLAGTTNRRSTSGILGAMEFRLNNDLDTNTYLGARDWETGLNLEVGLDSIQDLVYIKVVNESN